MDANGPIATPFHSPARYSPSDRVGSDGACLPPELAAAVTNAGGLGGLGFSWDSPQRVKDLIGAVRRLTNDGPFLANFVLEWDQHERMEAALSAGARIVSFCWGDIAPYVDRAKTAGALVVHTVGTPEEARRAIDLGVDVLVAQGNEAGGHVWSR